MNFIISVIILLLPCMLGVWGAYWLWMRGILGRIFLMGVFMCGAVEAHSIIYPQKNLNEKYARLINYHKTGEFHE
jgi:hypothetical protein